MGALDSNGSLAMIAVVIPVGMAIRLHHLKRASSMNRHVQKRLSVWEAGVVSDSVKGPDVKSKDQTWTCRHLRRSKIPMAFTMPDNALLAGIHAAGNALHGQRQSPVHAKSHHARARCRWERVSSGPCRVT